MGEFLVGCPVYRREWILPQWFEHVERGFEVAGVKPTYAFVVDDRDEKTIEAIANHGGSGYVFCVREPQEHDGARRWNWDRYHWMVELRNELLNVVRMAEADHFFSLDSDILLHNDCLANLIESIEDCDAVGGKAYMTDHGKWAPSFAFLSRGPGGGLKRYEADNVFRCDVIMAIKLMKPSAYNVDYVFDQQGEDIGWSKACAKAGLKLMWDGRVTSKHVMAPHQLAAIDERVGY